MTVTLEEAARFVSNEATRRNGKLVPKLPQALAELCHNAKYYIFNVGPWDWDRQLGGKGTKFLAKCPDGQPYGPAPLTFGLLDNETVAVDMNKMENRQEDGIEIVNAFLSRGRDCRPENNLEQWGLGVTETWPPTTQDLAEANKRLDLKCDELIRDADRFYEQRQHDNIVDTHRWAARRKKLKKDWLNENPELVACPACGQSVMPNIAKCPHCRATLDETKARKFFPEEYNRKSV
jgi:rubrerythrin